MLDMKVFFLKKESFYILGYLLDLIIKLNDFEKENLQNLANLGHSFHEKSFIYVEIIFFQVEIWHKFTRKWNTASL
jgi:hypothetical protein